MMMATGLCALHGLFGHLHHEIAAPAAGSMPRLLAGGGAGDEVLLGAILVGALVVLAVGFRAAGRPLVQPTAGAAVPAKYRKG